LQSRLDLSKIDFGPEKVDLGVECRFASINARLSGSTGRYVLESRPILPTSGFVVNDSKSHKTLVDGRIWFFVCFATVESV
jgi:hypothetical protein